MRKLVKVAYVLLDIFISFVFAIMQTKIILYAKLTNLTYLHIDKK